jgi:hypothetical protein
MIASRSDECELVREPFLLLGIISAIRRVLILAAKFGELRGKAETVFQNFVIELAAHTVLTLALTVSLVLLQKAGAAAVSNVAGFIQMAT